MTKPLTATVCAITFQGNASNNIQQDAIYMNDKCYQKRNLVVTEKQFDDEFCVAVADGVADSPLSQHASLAIVRAVKKNWHNYLADASGLKPIMTMSNINHAIPDSAHMNFGAKSTLAMLYKLRNKTDRATNEVVIKHVGDSRIYQFSNHKDDKQQAQWHFLTRDHNLANYVLDEQYKAKGERTPFHEYNQEGMASSLYSLTECFALGDEFDTPTPHSDSNIIRIQSGDVFVVCSDGIHDLVSCEQWQPIDQNTDLETWLRDLKQAVYDAEGNAYDNASAVVIRFQ